MVSVVSSMSSIPMDDWDTCATESSGVESLNPFLLHSFFSSLEDSGSAIAVRLLAKFKLGLGRHIAGYSRSAIGYEWFIKCMNLFDYLHWMQCFFLCCSPYLNFECFNTQAYADHKQVNITSIALELQEKGWSPQHLVARDESGGILGVVPLYLKRFLPHFLLSIIECLVAAVVFFVEDSIGLFSCPTLLWL